MLFFIAAGWGAPFHLLILIRGVDGSGTDMFEDTALEVDVEGAVVIALGISTDEIWILVFRSTGIFSSGMLLLWINV